MGIVPYKQSERARKRQPLDRARIVSAALALLDEVGLDQLTMRRLADKLGVKAASLYRHVRDKDELLVLLGDEISGQIPPMSETGPWRQRLIDMAFNVRRGLLAHRDAARLLAITPPFGPRRLRHIETMLKMLRDAGLSPRDAVRAAYHCNNFVTEFAADEARFSAYAGSSRKKTLALARKEFKSLPPAEYPTVVSLADELAADDSDGLFRFGLDIWLAGIEGLVRRRA